MSFPQMNSGELEVLTMEGMDPVSNISFDSNVVSFSLKFNGLQNLSIASPNELLQYLQNLDSAADVTVDKGLVRAVMINEFKQSLKEQIEIAQLMSPDVSYTEEEIDALAEQQLEQQLDMLVAQNFVAREEDKLKSSATFKHGQLMVNGRVLSLFQGL